MLVVDASSLSLSQRNIPSKVGQLTILERLDGVHSTGFNLRHSLHVSVRLGRLASAARNTPALDSLRQFRNVLDHR